jgi:hypothetical protein
MHPRNEFREPAILEKETGLYVTSSQLRYFLNRPKGGEQFQSEAKKWTNYKTRCYIWNFIYDMQEDSNNFMYWDHVQRRVRLKFDTKSKAYRYLTEKGIDLEKFA